MVCFGKKLCKKVYHKFALNFHTKIYLFKHIQGKLFYPFLFCAEEHLFSNFIDSVPLTVQWSLQINSTAMALMDFSHYIYDIYIEPFQVIAVLVIGSPR